MGNDGGTIPTRGELVRTSGLKSKEDYFESTRISQESLWTTCQLSRKPLAVPIVSDYLGRLFNKEAVIQFIIDPGEYSSVSSIFSHITSLKDVVELHLEEISPGQWICPISQKEIGNNGTHFGYIVNCGHVFSLKALKEVAGEQCPECGVGYEPENVVPINSVDVDELERLEKRLEKLKEKGLTHTLKKVKKTGKHSHKTKISKHKLPKEHLTLEEKKKLKN